MPKFLELPPGLWRLILIGCIDLFVGALIFGGAAHTGA
jgi:hypothetical protein